MDVSEGRRGGQRGYIVWGDGNAMKLPWGSFGLMGYWLMQAKWHSELLHGHRQPISHGLHVGLFANPYFIKTFCLRFSDCFSYVFGLTEGKEAARDLGGVQIGSDVLNIYPDLMIPRHSEERPFT